jgi:hypothetical protein
VFGRSDKSAPVAEAERPVLHLSGPRLAAALESLIEGSEQDGGIERYVAAVGLKVDLFRDALADGRARRLDEGTFKTLCAFMAPVRRRIGARLEAGGFRTLREAIVALFDDAAEETRVDAAVRSFCTDFPDDKQHRWVRDLAAEILHYGDPERFPLMARWVWDARANTGVLREIWHGPDLDHRALDVPDGFHTFLVLRAELSQFLTDNGVFRDMPLYVDLLLAQVYAGYISAQGGSFLRTDFTAPDDPMRYTRRMLGLDGLNPNTGRTRLKLIDWEARVPDDARRLG